VLGLINLLPIVGQFFIGFSVIIISFGAGLNMLYGAFSSEWSGGQEYIDSLQNALAGLNNRVTNNLFQPYLVFWFGDAVIFCYLIICAIILVNMLIAMMNTRFEELSSSFILQRKRNMYKGANFVFLEHTVLPMPLNTFHILWILALKSVQKPTDPFRFFARWTFYTLPVQYVFTGLLRHMWIQYLEWKKQPKKDDEKENADNGGADIFKEPDRYSPDADGEAELYATHLASVQPFVNQYFEKWADSSNNPFSPRATPRPQIELSKSLRTGSEAKSSSSSQSMEKDPLKTKSKKEKKSSSTIIEQIPLDQENDNKYVKMKNQ